MTDPLPPTSESALDIRKLFLAALVLGAGTIVAGQLLGNPLLTVALPVLVMFAYIATGFYRRSADPVLEQFADSIYYLGFLFTLIALVASLYAFRTESLVIGRLVSNFALALITTIVGLSARIVINDFRGEADSTRRRAQDELDRTTHRLILEARGIALRLEALNNEVHYTITASLDQAREGMTRAGEEIERHARLGSGALLKSVRETGDGLLRLVTEFETKLGRIQFPEEVFEHRLEARLEAVLEATETLPASLAAGTEALHRVVAGFEREANAGERVATEIAALVAGLERARRGVDQLGDLGNQLQAGADRTRAYVEALEGQTATLEALDRVARARLASLHEQEEAMHAILAESRAALGAVGEHLVGAVRYIDGRLNDHSPNP